LDSIKLQSEIHPKAVQVDLAKSMPAENLLAAVNTYNWDMYPADVLSVIARRDDCSLITALHIFAASEPAYYEGSSSKGDPAILAMLHEIHERVNSEKYSHNERDHLSEFNVAPITFLLAPRDQPSSSKGKVLWAFDPAIVAPALEMPEHIKADLTARGQPITASQRRTAEGYAIAIFCKGPGEEAARLAMAVSGKKLVAHVQTLLDQPEQMKALIAARKSKPVDVLKLPPASLIHALRLSRLSRISAQDELMVKFNPKSHGSVPPHIWRNFGKDYWGAGFGVKDMLQEMGEHPEIMLNDYLIQLTGKYGALEDYHSRSTHFIRAYPTTPIEVLNKTVQEIRLKLADHSIWARYKFIRTSMFVGLTDFMIGSHEETEQIRGAIPVSRELEEARETYRQSVENFEKRMKVAEKFLASVKKFLRQDVDLSLWEERPRWSQFRQNSSWS